MNREQFDEHLRRVPAVVPHGQFESPIERALAWSISKHLYQTGVSVDSGVAEATHTGYNAQLVAQVNIPTRCGTFRGDLVLHSEHLNTLIECDGRAFHGDPFDDELRSALILETGLIDQVIRFNGTMLHHAPDDGAFFVRQIHPATFLPGAEVVLNIKATPEARGVLAQARGRSFDITYAVQVPTDEAEYDLDDNHLTRRADFSMRYHHRESPEGRIAEFLAVLAHTSPRTPQELERLYWKALEDREEEKGTDLLDKIWGNLNRDVPAGEWLRDQPEVFAEGWASLEHCFGPQSQARADRALEFLGTKLSADEFRLACRTATASHRHFPSRRSILNYSQYGRWDEARE